MIKGEMDLTLGMGVNAPVVNASVCHKTHAKRGDNIFLDPLEGSWNL